MSLLSLCSGNFNRQGQGKGLVRSVFIVT